MKKWLSVCIVLLLLIFHGYSIAEDKENEEKASITMEEVVVTATRHEESVRKVPSNVTVITAQEISESGSTSITDLLKTRANIHVRELNGNASQAIVDLRSFGGDNPYGKTLVLLDGKRMNRPDMTSINWPGNWQFPAAGVIKLFSPQCVKEDYIIIFSAEDFLKKQF